MTVTVNGKTRQLPDGATICAMLQEIGIAKGRVAVEVNRQVVPRGQHEVTTLSEGDAIEVVTFVGGG